MLPLGLLGLLALLLGACFGLQAAPEVRRIDGWINSQPLTLEELQGKVVLVDFWTYSCVNCIRTFPYLKDWHEKYTDYGLVIIGVHTPEFEFEKRKENVVEAARAYGLEYPIAQDNNYATWNAYSNNAWPAKYLVDQHGFIRYHHIGEGAYAETEEKIRELLAETGVSLDKIDANLEPDPEFDSRARAADHQKSLTRELYAGYGRNQRLPSSALGTLFGPSPAFIMHEEYYQQKDAAILYQDPGGHFNHFIYLQGMWRNGPQSLTHASTTDDFEDYIAIKFYATSVNAVMSRGTALTSPSPPYQGGAQEGLREQRTVDGEDSAPSKVQVMLDGEPLDASQAGNDVSFDKDGNSYILVDQPRLYSVVELPEFSGHALRLSAHSANFSLFAFTFGAYEEGP